MGQVNIRGLVNTTYLREGERATVEHTDTIDQLAKQGFIKVEFAKGGVAPRPMAPPEPRRGASKAKWVDWLTLNGVDVSDDDTKTDLIERWMGRAV